MKSTDDIHNLTDHIYKVCLPNDGNDARTVVFFLTIFFFFFFFGGGGGGGGGAGN